MPRLPDAIDFNDLDYPELTDIFHSIDAGIAAIVASDPAFRRKPAQKRRARTGKAGGATSGIRRAERKAA
ncbi:hypothetical protein [Devosia nitrariae]|uniref:Uncharacterized protein n=1 Tax=Devosia nitrariae TaxID=2071872 RepID=A0ABQ5W1Y5_9HYPH|nr:hypothetical protein [Devosia nitrariae]GLQ53884.1 hypothetical protein GCM10010862_11430 [Devosia nitrariae]